MTDRPTAGAIWIDAATSGPIHGALGGGRSSEESIGQCAALNPHVTGHLAQNGGQCADAELRVVRDGEVMLAVLQRGQAQMAARLPRDGVAKALERARQVAP
jgi:hypothetical protein